MIPTIVKNVVKIGAKIGFSVAATKFIFKLGYELGQAFQLVTFNKINEKEPGYIYDYLNMSSSIYDTNDTEKTLVYELPDIADKVNNLIDNGGDITDRWSPFAYSLVNQSHTDKVIRYGSRFITYKLSNYKEFRACAYIVPHQSYLTDLINHKKTSKKFLTLALADPKDLGYKFEFDRYLMYEIAYKNNVIYIENNSFYGLEDNVKYLGQHFWTDYNLLAMDRGLPGIDINHYTHDRFNTDYE